MSCRLLFFTAKLVDFPFRKNTYSNLTGRMYTCHHDITPEDTFAVST